MFIMLTVNNCHVPEATNLAPICYPVPTSSTRPIIKHVPGQPTFTLTKLTNAGRLNLEELTVRLTVPLHTNGQWRKKQGGTRSGRRTIQSHTVQQCKQRPQTKSLRLPPLSTFIPPHEPSHTIGRKSAYHGTRRRRRRRGPPPVQHPPNEQREAISQRQGNVGSDTATTTDTKAAGLTAQDCAARHETGIQR